MKISDIELCFNFDSSRWWSPHCITYSTLRYQKKIHPPIQHNGGRKMGVKNPNIFTPKVVLDPNSIFKNHYFVTYKPHLSLTEVTWTYLGSEGFFERYPNTYQVDFEISKKILHPWDVPYGGMFLEVKNPKNRTPKVILHPNTIFKSHQFVVIILIHSYIHSSRQTIGPRDTFYVTYY